MTWWILLAMITERSAQLLILIEAGKSYTTTWVQQLFAYMLVGWMENMSRAIAISKWKAAPSSADVWR